MWSALLVLRLHSQCGVCTTSAEEFALQARSILLPMRSLHCLCGVLHSQCVVLHSQCEVGTTRAEECALQVRSLVPPVQSHALLVRIVLYLCEVTPI